MPVYLMYEAKCDLCSASVDMPTDDIDRLELVLREIGWYTEKHFLCSDFPDTVICKICTDKIATSRSIPSPCD